jgi:RHS repeat-associated protein
MHSAEDLDVFFDDLSLQHSSGPIVRTDDYYPFGLTFNTSTLTGARTNKYLYTGHEHQAENGLGWYAHHFRDYDPQLGRWHVADPVAALYPGISPYHYCYNNPVVFMDPLGLFGEDNPGQWDDTDGYGRQKYDRWNVFVAPMDREGGLNPTGVPANGSIEDRFQLSSGLWMQETYGHTRVDVMNSDGSVLYSTTNSELLDITFVSAGIIYRAPRGAGANSSGDLYQYAIDAAGIIGGAVGTYYGFKGNATHNELYWQGKNRKLYSTSKLNKPGGYARSYNVVKNSLRVPKGLSNSMAGVGLLITGVDIAYNQHVNASHAVNAFMAGISFTGIGSLVAGAYFVTDLGFNVITGTSLGERIDNVVGGSLYEW